MRQNNALLVVDLQADFTELHQGPLAVPDTTSVYVDQVSAAARSLKKQGLPVIASKDFHPSDHISFYTSHQERSPFDLIDLGGKSQVLWPIHCVQGTAGARIILPPDIGYLEVAKGYRKDVESYSAFYDDDHGSTGLTDILHTLETTTILLCGIATDYCVLATAMHGLQEGFKVEVFIDLCRGIDTTATSAAIKTMEQGGVIIRHFLD